MKYFCVLLFSAISAHAFALPSFPGAQGAGAESVGGRGGAVYVVDTLSDNPNDGVTFREACQAVGARTVLFAVSGHIELTSLLEIENPLITIAGQSSPGGVSITGWPVRVLTSNVIITHMRFRRGCENCDWNGGSVDCETNGESLFIGNGTDIIVDHCSVLWSTDEALQVGSYWGDVSNVTISYSIIGEGLNEQNHGYGMLISYKFAENLMPQDISIHHNYLAHTQDRTPQLVGPIGPIDFRNNVVYDWKGRLSPRVIVSDAYLSRGEWLGSDIGYAAYVNFVENYMKMGPNSNAAIPTASSAEVNLASNDHTPEARVYVHNNLGVTRDDPGDPQWCVGCYSGECSGFVSTGWQASSPHVMDGIPVTTTAMTYDYALSVVSKVGATRPERDSADTAITGHFAAGAGDIIDSVTFPADFPSYSTPAPPTDSDNDGISDAWEIAEYGDLEQSQYTDSDGDGYSDLEEYLHFLGGYVDACGVLGDTDGDGICDDGDGSQVAGDNKCTNGNRQNCDDNCVTIGNPDQEDGDGDGVGDICEPQDGGLADAAVVDTAVFDATVADAVVVDAAVVDAAVNDADIADAVVVDAAVNDADIADAVVVDAVVDDAVVVDAVVVDISQADVAVADSQVVDACAPDTFSADAFSVDVAIAGDLGNTADAPHVDIVVADGGTQENPKNPAEETDVSNGCHCAQISEVSLLALSLFGLFVFRRGRLQHN